MSARRTAPISARTGGVLAAIGLIAFGAAAAVTVFGDDLPDIVVRPSVYSSSALGHRALFEHLGETQTRPVIAQRRGSAAIAAQSSLYILAEPARPTLLDGALSWTSHARRAVVVLPKRTGAPDPERPDWIGRHGLDRVWPALNLRRLEEAAEIVRPEGEIAWTVTGDLPPPTLGDTQLITGWDFTETLIGTDEGVLVGVVTTGGKKKAPGTLFIADPDLIANHGFDDGENAELVTRLLIDFAQGDGPIVFDETIHGFTQELSIWRRLFSFPYAIVGLGALLAMAAAAWAAVTRFGPAAREAAQRIGGRMTLIRSAASLTLSAGHGAEAFRHYAETMVKQAAQRLKPPRSLADATLAAWLDAAAEARGLTPFSAQRRRIAEARTAAEAQAVAQEIYHWVLEFDDGYERGRHTGR